jgi:hypothetical protein
MSEGVEPRLVDAPLATPAQPSESVPREERARLSGYRRRFGIVYVLLALATGVAVGALIVEALRDPTPSEAVPTGSTPQLPVSEPGELGAMQIADQVQRNYRLPNGDELVNVVASRNTLQDGNLGYLRVRFQVIRPGDGFKDKDSLLVQPDDAIQYSLCGAGQSCAIPGTASTDRGILVRRMGLELALRTLKFDPSIDNVTVFLGPIPPPQGVDAVVLMYRRNVLENQNPGLLSQPISRTLPGAERRIEPGLMPADVARRVDQLTRSNLYYGVYQLIGGRDALLQLQPFPKG